MHDRCQIKPAQGFTALRQTLVMGMHLPQIRKLGALDPEQVMIDPLKILTNDAKP